LYQLFYDGDEPPKLQDFFKRKTSAEAAWGSSGKGAQILLNSRKLLGRIGEGDRKLLLFVAQKMAAKRNPRKSMAARAK